MNVRQYFKKKAQVEMSETVLVLFILGIILVIAIFFYYKFFSGSLEQRGEELEEEKASIMLVSVGSMPEIKCNSDDCLDTAKLLIFGSKARDNFDYYKTSFGDKKIIVEQVYPDNKENKTCDFKSYNDANYPGNCKKWILYNNIKGKGFLVSTPVSLHYPETESYGIGKLIIEAAR